MARKKETAAATAAPGVWSVAFSPRAPFTERYDAQAEINKSTLESALIPRAEIQPVIDFIQQEIAAEAFNKSINQVKYPSQSRKGGMQSVMLDDFQIAAQGQYWDRPGLLNFDSMRTMVDQTPILNAIVLTRIRQVLRFCRPQLEPEAPGFVIHHIDKNHELNAENKQSIDLLQKFVLNCGWEDDPRKRKLLKRDTFPQFMAKRIRDSLAMDAAPVETQFKSDKSLGLDGIYAVDGATVRLCTEEGYDGDDEVFALQVIQGNIRTAYTHYDLTYEVRNPRTDVLACGYGYGETEMLIRVVTHLLNTLEYNGSYFTKNSIPRGILQLVGNYDNADLAAFKRLWVAMVRGIQNVHNLPILTSRDADAKANFLEVGAQMTEMAFGKWMSLLTSLACAIYGIAPEEVSMESFTSGRAPLSGSDTEQKITSSNDKGLEPLLSHFACEYTDFFIRPFSPQYSLRFVGLDGEDADKRFEMRKLTQTWNEARRRQGDEEVDDVMGDCPLNPALISPWLQFKQQEMQAQQADFGMPDDGNPGEPLQGDQPGGPPAPGQDQGEPGQEQGGNPEKREGDFGQSDDSFAKAIDPSRFGLKPIYALGK